MARSFHSRPFHTRTFRSRTHNKFDAVVNSNLFIDSDVLSSLSFSGTDPTKITTARDLNNSSVNISQTAFDARRPTYTTESDGTHSMSFDGTANFMDYVGLSGTTSLLPAQGDFHLFLYVNINSSAAGNRDILSQSDNASSNRLNFKVSSYNIGATSKVQIMHTNRYIILELIRSGDNFVTRYNKAAVRVQKITGVSLMQTIMRIGSSAGAGNVFIPMKLKRIAFYNRVIKDQQLQTVYRRMINNDAAFNFIEAPMLAFHGQSNCSGQGTVANLSATLQASMPNAKVLFKTSESATTNDGTPQALLAGTNNDLYNFGGAYSVSPPGKYGFETNLMYLYSNYYNKLCVLAKYGKGGTSLAVNWNKTANTLYPIAIDGYIYNLTVQMIGLGYIPNLRAVLWMQGESDADDATEASNYQANLTQFISDVRADLFYPNLKFIIYRIGLITTGTFPFRDTVRAAQSNVASADPNIVLIDTDAYGLQADNTHFTDAGFIQGGLDGFNAVKNL